MLPSFFFGGVHERLADLAAKYVINGLPGGSGTSAIQPFSIKSAEKFLIQNKLLKSINQL